MRQKIADVVTGVAAAVVVFVAVPAVLIAFVGVPVPHPWDRADVVSSRGLFDLLAVMAWVAWVACCWPLLCSVAVRVRRRDAAAAPNARLTEWLATRIAAAVLTVVPVAMSLGAVAGASGHKVAPAAQVATASPAPSPAPLRSPAAPAPAATPEAAPAPATAIGPAAAPPSDAASPTEYTVVSGDTLWSIAEHFYGDGASWSVIARSNLGHVMADGLRFVDPSFILPGWQLTIPATGPGLLDPPGAPSAPSTPDATTTDASVAPAAGTASTTAMAAPASAPWATGRTGPAEPATDAVPTVDAPRGPGGTGRHHRRSARIGGRAAGRVAVGHPDPGGGPTPVPLPELLALGVGVVLAAAFARRARRVRSVAALGRPEGVAPGPVSEPAAETAALLAPFSDAPVLDWLETANRQLAGAMARTARVDELPAVRLVRVGPDGVELYLAGPVHWEPARWTRRGEASWHLSSALDPAVLAAEALEHEPWLPVLLPVGENAEGTWLVPVQPGHCLSVLGPEADAQVAAMRAAAESWGWSEELVVTADAGTARREASMADAAMPGKGSAPLLFVGDPHQLGDEARARCAVLTTLVLEAAELTVVVDARAASVHPLGLTVRPHLLGGRRVAALDDLFDAVADGPAGPGDPGRVGEGRGAGSSAAPDGPAAGDATQGAGTEEAAPARRPAVAARDRAADLDALAGPLVPGPVEVRLLTPVPRIEGLTDALPPKRARRAVELIAYLALHHPEPITSDRLRTRVLGSADADAAAKTLFNTAGAGRRALGRDDNGDPYLPLATRAGHYRVSELVTVDATRAVALVGAAELADDPTESMALQRAALSLIEGEPLSGILTGYNWWAAEGHERRVAAALVDGACRLARRAMTTGHLALARWAIERARLVDPYSEALSRVAMEVAAGAGDTDALRHEWADCQRRVDELDPGGLPAEATERLYADLRRKLPATAEPAR